MRYLEALLVTGKFGSSRGQALSRAIVFLAGSAILAITASCGSGPNSVTPPASPVLAMFAGNASIQGSANGTGLAARFRDPTAVATDTAGNIYVADYRNNTIRKITSDGVVTTLAGTAGVVGSTDGTGAAASFYLPTGVATDASGNVYVADYGNAIIRKITPAGVVTTLAGTAGLTGSTDGTGAAARFRGPEGIAADSAGNVYVADSVDHIIRKITSAGVVTTLAGTAGVFGSADGTGAAARFDTPTGVATDAFGNVYVADSLNDAIRVIDPSGVVTTLAGTPGTPGSLDGTGAAARFNLPTAVATDASGNVYVADKGNYTIRRIAPGAVVTTLAGSAGLIGNADGTGAAAGFAGPYGVATDVSSGNLFVYVADSSNNTVRKIVASTAAVTTLAGTAGAIGHADGTATAATLAFPTGIAADASGNLFVSDSGNNTIRMITPSAQVSTLAGTAGTTGSADSTGAAASFADPIGVAIDASGNLLVVDSNNSTIRKITPAGLVTTLAGTAGVTGSADGTGAAARFSFPRGIAADASGNAYVADTLNHTIRKITPAGEVTTLAGTGTPGSTDGTGTAASFDHPAGVASDAAGNLYVADSANNTIRKITPAGVVTTLAGSAGVLGNTDGTGAAARFDGPEGVATDAAGNVYVADFYNSTIRKITPGGVVTTIVGAAGTADFTPGALPGVISFPEYVTVQGTTLYITMNNGVVAVQNLP